MNKYDYFRYSLKNRFPTKLKWGFDMLTNIVDKTYKDEYIVISEGTFKVKVDDKLVVLTNYLDEPLFAVNEKITLTSKDMSCIKSKVETTIGIALINYILLELNFKDKLPFYEEGISKGKLLDDVASKLRSDEITVNSYKKFVNACMFLEGYSRIVTVSSTEKNMLPPKGLAIYKAKLTKEFVEKYGKRWTEDSSLVVEYEKKLKAFYEEYIKHDRSFRRQYNTRTDNYGYSRV